MLNGPFDPLVGLAHAAARTEHLKLGAYLIVPGRNPVRLARELANLDRLSGGRLLLIMVLGQPSARSCWRSTCQSRTWRPPGGGYPLTATLVEW